MQVTKHTTTDGRRCVSVTFQPERPATDTPSVVVVYRVYIPQDFTVRGEPFALVPLSCTRTDSREPFGLEPEESERALEAAASFVASQDLDEPW